jgi:hypothetical protein
MRGFLVALVTLALLFLLVRWIGFDSRGTDIGPAPISGEGDVVGKRDLVPAGLLEVQGDAGRGVAEARVQEKGGVEAGVETARDAATCELVGIVADEREARLPEVRVRLQAFRVWTEGIDVPRLPGPWDHRGWEVHSDAQGRFRFEVPVPTAKLTWLTLHPDPHHDSARIDFGSAQSGGRPALAAGRTDLGTIRLGRTGSIEGIALDLHGIPLAGVELDSGPECPQTWNRGGTSDAEGRYTIPHVPPGVGTVSAKLGGYLDACFEKVIVDAGRTTRGVDLRLGAAPTISGFVLDSSGAALEGVRINGRPAGGGRPRWRSPASTEASGSTCGRIERTG